MKRMRILSLFVILSLLFGAVAAGCAQPTEAPTEAPAEEEEPAEEEPAEEEPAEEAEPLKIAMLAAMSGDVKTFGEGTKRGVDMAVAEWNAKGGVLGREIEIIVGDTKCDAQEAANVANKVINQDKVNYIVGAVCSSASIPISEIANPAGVVQISPPSTNPQVTIKEDGSNKEYIFRACFLDPFQGEVDAAFAMEELGAETAASLYDVGNDYVKGLAEYFKASFEDMGGEVPVFEAYTKEDTDFSALLTKVAEADVDVLFLPDYYNKVNVIAKQAKEKGIEATMLGADGWDSPDLDLEAVDGAYFSNHYSPYDPRPIVQDFVGSFESEYDMTPDFVAVLAYDATNVLLEAIEDAGVDDPAKVKDALAAIEFEGVAGDIRFDEHGDPIKKAAISHITDGEIEFVKFVAPPGEEAVEEVVAPEGTFIFGRGGDSVQLDPAVVTDGESFRVTGQVLEPLFQYEDNGTRPIPALATNYSVSDDGKVWTINLREGVKFHDGTDFNAEAVVFNFERQRLTDHEYHFESQNYTYYNYMWQGFDDDSMIQAVEAVDEYTVEFTLREPLAPMLANLAMDMFAISSPTQMKECGETYGTPTCGPVGTGPFKFVEWIEDDHITVEANMDYWGGAPSIGKVIWRVIPDDSARFLALKAGDIHALEQAGIEDIKMAEEDPNMYIKATGLNTGYLAPNYHIEELRDPLVREAIYHAIDREAIRQAFYGSYGEVASTFLHPSMWGRPDLEDWAYDPELSKELLAEAGYPDGLTEVTNMDTGEVGPLKLYYMPVTRFYYPSPKEIAEAMAADLAKVGIETELYLEGDWPTYLDANTNGTLYGLYMLGWGGDNGDPDNFLNFHFGQVGKEGGDPQAGWYYNPELDELLDEAAVTVDQDARAEMYKEAERMLHEDRAWLWMMHNNTPRLFSSVVEGFVVQPVGADKYEGVTLTE